MSNSDAWYVVRQEDGSCKVVPADEVAIEEEATQREQWGPFESQGVAIARRVGLIRAGKCKPV
ncbi:hypothetical protein [Phormidesmis priestleyi]|uniref:hypothetical protein n=1 Tax=Phormidesmis priestleyi TaxID=268141 RepID=UPI00083AC97D|nr:hypothetical protein [Phormidesmis priestleyi]